MITMGIAALGGIMYATGNYSGAFWLIVLAIISGAGAVVKAIANPDWYADQRIKAGLDIDLFNPQKGIGSLIVTKSILIVLLRWLLGGLQARSAICRRNLPAQILERSHGSI